MATRSMSGSTWWWIATGIPSTGTVSVIDADKKALSKEIEVGLHPSALALSPKGDRLFVANANSDTVSVIDTATDSVLYSINVRPADKAPIGSSPNALAVGGDGKTLYVANGANNAIAVVDVAQPGRVRAGFRPAGIRQRWPWPGTRSCGWRAATASVPLRRLRRIARGEAIAIGWA